MNIETLIKFCQKHGLCFDLLYSESEDNFTLTLHGAGSGESFVVRKIKNLDDAIMYAIDDAMKFYGSLNAPQQSQAMIINEDAIIEVEMVEY